jgi:hypothetical protein
LRSSLRCQARSFTRRATRLFGDPLVSERFASYLRRIEEIMDRAGFSEVEKRQKWRELYEEYAKRDFQNRRLL